MSSGFFDEMFDDGDKGKPKSVVDVLSGSFGYNQTTKFHHGMWFSPSKISGCRRATYLSVKHQLERSKSVSPKMDFSSEIGTAYHGMTQGRLGRLGVLKGGWRCSDCGHVVGVDEDDITEVFSHGRWFSQKVTVKSAVFMPSVCPSCGMKPGWDRSFSFVEPMFYDTLIRTVGRADGILDIGGLKLVDIKTIESFSPRIELPKEEHVEQLTWYMGLSGIHSGVLLYEARIEVNPERFSLEIPVAFDRERYNGQFAFVRRLCSYGNKEEEEIEARAEVPSCQYGGKRPWGPCECSWIED